ncbi:MAG: phosphoglucosamine mutase [Oscillospiraceae bacterium]|nr:phosphoglucosamine mutase [Oscillospiraceae bacterium]
MARLFGTDGVRGVAITELTTELALNIGKALVSLLRTQDGNGSPHTTVIIGKDTRRSSDILEAALIAGITAAGGDARTIGVVPTPAVAHLVKQYNADAGVMITASHNSAEFNGIKLFNKDGLKFPDEREDEIERLVRNPGLITLKIGGEVGTVANLKSAVDDYSKTLSGISGGKIKDVKILIDCANGSASVMGEVLSGLAEHCTIINNTPDGMNINDKCGSTYIESLAKQVTDEKFDLGIAFDGDADRMLAVEHHGKLVDGDKIIALLAGYMKERGELNNDTAVVTVMSNLGFHQYMSKNGLKTAVVQVGDRYVLEKMLEDNYSIGGEQSGHIIFKAHATTGDGILTAIKLINMMKDREKSLNELVSEIPTFPQTLKNVTIAASKKGTWESNAAITAVINEIKAIAGRESRILIRESGTEPLLRVMLEGKVQEEIEQWADKICQVAKQELC